MAGAKVMVNQIHKSTKGHDFTEGPRKYFSINTEDT